MTALTEPRTTRPGRLWRGLLGAVMFLTVVPVPVTSRANASVSGDDYSLASAAGWFAIVGALIGAVGGGVRLGLVPLIGQAASTVVAMIVMVSVTGALHQDGLADVADGLGIRGDRARRLAVMRDSAIGTFGTLVLVGWALLLFAALQPLTSVQGLETMIAAGAAGRLAAVLHGRFTPAARPDGLGAAFAVGQVSLVLAAASTVAIVLVAVGPAHGVLALAAVLVVCGCSLVLARRAVGGRTGDTVGATVAITEVVVCLVLMGLWR